MDDITDGKSMVLKKIVRTGVGIIVPEGATVKGMRITHNAPTMQLTTTAVLVQNLLLM